MTKPLFDKILIANRSEIAVRIIRTLRRMGIGSVAVYSEADTNSMYVQHADEAYYIGDSPATESYLSIKNLVSAIRESGANAVHPGYGFLSENAAFAAALEKEGVAFIGPPSGAIEAMGDKITSKKIAQEAGVSTVPGYMGLIADAEEAVRISSQIGYPVMIKASAGGGGRGMRLERTAVGDRYVVERMRAAGLGNIPVIVGGIIPDDDAAQLRAMGVARVYTPKDFELNRIMMDLVARVEPGPHARRRPRDPAARDLRDPLVGRRT